MRFYFSKVSIFLKFFFKATQNVHNHIMGNQGAIQLLYQTGMSLAQQANCWSFPWPGTPTLRLWVAKRFSSFCLCSTRKSGAVIAVVIFLSEQTAWFDILSTVSCNCQPGEPFKGAAVSSPGSACLRLPSVARGGSSLWEHSSTPWESSCHRDKVVLGRNLSSLTSDLSPISNSVTSRHTKFTATAEERPDSSWNPHQEQDKLLFFWSLRLFENTLCAVLQVSNWLPPMKNFFQLRSHDDDDVVI